jgi:hypothetical protein
MTYPTHLIAAVATFFTDAIRHAHAALSGCPRRMVPDSFALCTTAVIWGILYQPEGLRRVDLSGSMAAPRTAGSCRKPAIPPGLVV